MFVNSRVLNKPLKNGNVFDMVARSLLRYPSLYITTGDVLANIFTLCGSGYMWNNDGNIVSDEIDAPTETLSTILTDFIDYSKKCALERFTESERLNLKIFSRSHQREYLVEAGTDLIKDAFETGRSVVDDYEKTLLSILSINSRMMEVSLRRDVKNLWFSSYSLISTMPNNVSDAWFEALASFIVSLSRQKDVMTKENQAQFEVAVEHVLSMKNLVFDDLCAYAQRFSLSLSTIVLRSFEL